MTIFIAIWIIVGYLAIGIGFYLFTLKMMAEEKITRLDMCYIDSSTDAVLTVIGWFMYAFFLVSDLKDNAHTESSYKKFQNKLIEKMKGNNDGQSS